ncbi:MAG TPA: M20/M25/M40 family metallo-hydrolase, partial [Thermoanaerobaculia bacterium]|nr:M20/M25/M40 family metallo-hydrolase [Thermoanaerobaculia bacterium]
PSSPASASPEASAVAEARAIVSELVACGTRLSLSSWSDPRRGVGCGRDAVVRRFRDISARTGGRLQVVVDKFQTTAPRTGNVPVPMENVYAVLPGRDPARDKTVFVVSGHFDSMPSDIMNPNLDAPGADDDASGVAVSILSAAALAARPEGFRATLVFAAVSGEEQGLLGSKRMKEWLAGQSYQVGGMMTDDIVGATNGSSDRRPRLFSEGGPDGVESPGREMARLADELNGRDRVRLVFRRDRFGRGGDHLPFVEAGLPAVRFTEPLEDYHHQHQTPRVENGVQYGDLVQYLDFPFLADVALANQRLLADLAAAPAPPWSVVLGGAVTASATITIEAADDPERAGFEMLHRETTEARWSTLKPSVGPGKTVFEGLSTDNEFFAVRSIGKNGAKSLAIPAVPAPRPPAGSLPIKPPGR